ncbi:flagellar hook-associated protein FlgK [Luedemannella flava]|uniref:Flagellar hook-associated protein 1 n=1 Tax=Luedemannella flava TaxID=349316 RepID=A0ABP4YJH7_9ACTN
MTSTFSGLSTALSALYAQRRGLDVTGQNIANANTEGYSRQRVDMRAIASQQVPAVHAVWSGAGAGVDVTAISRARDAFLEARGRAEHAQGAYLDVQKQVFGSVESIFTEPSDTALQSQFDDYWAAWHDVANNPGLLAARNQLLERGRVVTDGLSRAFDQLGAEFTISRSQLEAFATDINTTTKTIAELNQSINRAQAAGLPVNELADQRDLQLMHLAEVAGTTAIARPDGTMDVLLGGSTLVSGSSSRELKVGGGTRLEDLVTDPTGQRVSLQWADNGRTATATDGRVAAHLQSLNTILPDYANQLDAIAASLASSVNLAHGQGHDLNGNPGTAFFTGTTASTIKVAIDDPMLVAASSQAGAPNLDAGNADALAALGQKTDGADSAYRRLVAGLGVQSQSAARRAEIQAAVETEIDVARSSQSGVNLDEEMTNLLAYQRAYEAASRVFNSIDETLDTLINRTG